MQANCKTKKRQRNMKKFFFYLTVSIVMISFTWSMASCKEEEDEKKEGIPATLTGDWQKSTGATDWSIGITFEDTGRGFGYAHFGGDLQGKDSVMLYEWVINDYDYDVQTGKVRVIAEGIRKLVDEREESFLDTAMVFNYKSGKLTGIDTYLQKEWKNCSFEKE